MILLNPGPVTLSARVRRALAAEDLCHREPEFAELTAQVLRGLEAVYEQSADYTAVMLSGSGTAAVEAMLSTFAPRTRTTLVVSNGVYGERMAEMLRRQGKPLRTLRLEWTAPVEAAAVERELDGVAALAVVHHETTSGRLNELDRVAALCRARNIGLLIDAVSSLGAEEIAFERWGPLAVAGSANKCLHGVPGVSFVLARREALAAPSQATSLYFDLAGYAKEQARGWSPFTQAVQAVQALKEALEEHREEGGWRARRALFLARSTRVRRCLAEVDVEPLVPPSACASMLTAFRLPSGESYARVHDALKASGFVIYAGQGELANRIFRIATMGAIPDAELERLLAALRALFVTARAT